MVALLPTGAPGFSQLYYAMPECAFARGCRFAEAGADILPVYLKPVNFTAQKSGRLPEAGECSCRQQQRPGGSRYPGWQNSISSSPGLNSSNMRIPRFRLRRPIRFSSITSFFIADGYGANFISVADVTRQKMAGDLWRQNRRPYRKMAGSPPRMGLTPTSLTTTGWSSQTVQVHASRCMVSMGDSSPPTPCHPFLALRNRLYRMG